MSYLVLARRWRPQTFDEVIGQEPIVRALQNALITRRVAHAYLLAGPRGVGKTSVARILAKALNCPEGTTGQPCNACASCHEIREGIAVDVLEIDGASNRGIDEVRELRENVRYLPSKNKYKVYIIDEVHMLTDAAFNALLKTLEEPPPHVVFIFATTEPHKIPPTILSRCQRYDLRRIPTARIVEHLKTIAAREGVEVSEGSLHLIARQAEGSIRDAQSLLDRVLSFSGPKVSDGAVIEALGVIDRQLLHEAVEGVVAGDRGRLLQIAAKVHGFGYDPKHFCAELAGVLRDLLVMKTFSRDGQVPPGLLDLPEDEVRGLSAQAEKLTPEELHALFRSVLATHDEVARSAFPRLVLEMNLARLVLRRPILPVEEVLQKLQRMEERLGKEEPAGPAPAALSVPPTIPAASPPSARNSEPEGGRQEGGPVEEKWKTFLAFAKKKKPPLASLLEHGVPLALGGERLEIGYPENSFYLERMQEADTRTALQNLCAEFFRQDLPVHIAGLASRPPDRDPAGAGDGEGPSPADRKEKALNHPLVREAIHIFGGRVVEIKIG
ncbi:MAG: DNA polymerase III subunit gamma/tau [Deltaproteobacteria bacterium]|nr:DNA polymerase III subunit gamma/tau [Deltaproteobacteria bacterium]